MGKIFYVFDLLFILGFVNINRQNNRSYLIIKPFFICIKILWYFQTQVAGNY